MYCTNCGFRLEEGDSFCSHCGHKVGQKATSTENIFENVPARRKFLKKDSKIMAAPKSKLIAGILAIVLGSAGVHDFYLGYTSKGIVHLLMYIFFMGWLSQIWALVEALYIFTGKISTDADGVPLTDGF